jgi:hypothetical protein
MARLGLLREARAELEQGVSEWQSLAGERPTNQSLQWEPVRWSSRLARVLLKAGRLDDAVKTQERGRTTLRRLESTETVDAYGRESAAVCETIAGAALLACGRLAEARDCCDHAIAIREELAKLNPENTGYAQGLAESLLRSGSVRIATGDVTGAATTLRRAAALYAAHPPHNEPAIFHACCHGALAGLAGKAGSGVPAEEGAAHAEQAMAILQQVNASGYRDPDLLRFEPGLDPLRSRTDFGDVMLDQTFPSEPFAMER